MNFKHLGNDHTADGRTVDGHTVDGSAAGDAASDEGSVSERISETNEVLRRNGFSVSGPSLNSVETLRQVDARLRNRYGSVLAAVWRRELVAAKGATPVRSKVHVCALDPECRQLGVWGRIAVTFRGRHLSVAVTPGDCFVVRKADGTFGSRWFDRRVAPGWSCDRVVFADLRSYAGQIFLTTVRTCPLRTGHRGGCLDTVKNIRVYAPDRSIQPFPAR